MTHTLHRSGRPDSLRGDFVVFTMSAKQVNARGSAEKMRRFIEIVEKHGPVNCGDMKTGNVLNISRDEIFDNVRDTSIVHFVFTDLAQVTEVLQELKEADLGTSVVVSGLVGEIGRACREVGLKMHTVEFSGGVHGRIERLPSEPVLALTTMCGHGMVARGLVKSLAAKVKRGRLSLDQAALELARPCQCGVFNPRRAEELIREVIDSEA